MTIYRDIDGHTVELRHHAASAFATMRGALPPVAYSAQFLGSDASLRKIASGPLAATAAPY